MPLNLGGSVEVGGIVERSHVAPAHGHHDAGLGEYTPEEAARQEGQQANRQHVKVEGGSAPVGPMPQVEENSKYRHDKGDKHDAPRL